jgi:hypothetical protein
MKARLVLLIALAAGAAVAQPPRPDQTLEKSNPAPAPASRMVYDQREQVEIHRGHLAFDGMAVEAVKSTRHLGIFNPFSRANAGPMPDNTVWADEKRTKATGWGIFSIRF